jgi:hypothetical protein
MAMVTTVTAKMEMLTPWMHHNGPILIETDTGIIQKEQLQTAVHPSTVSQSKTGTDALTEIWMDIPILMKTGPLFKARMPFLLMVRNGPMVMETVTGTML